MRSRPMVPNLVDYEVEVENQFRDILNITRDTKLPDWSMQDLEKVLKSLKSKQSQDTMGLVNEIFLPSNIGSDMKASLLTLFNRVKNNAYIPDFFKNVYITAIPKKHKSPLNLESQRGICLVPKLRSVFLKLLYNSIIGVIEDNLSPSNIGARKGRSPRDHLFVLYAVINETLKRKDGCSIDLVFYDVTQCYDSLWVPKTLLDLYDNNVKSNAINIINEMTKESNVAVKTPVGVSDNVTINDTIMQGENVSSILCTNTVDKIAKDCDIEHFEYRKVKLIPKVGFVDDILDVAKCGSETKAMNKYTTDEVNKRRLQLSFDKCARLHINPKSKVKSDVNECEDVSIDLWTVESDESKTFQYDKYHGKVNLKTVEEYSYLGNRIQIDGSNTLTIKDRTNKGQGFSRDILFILENTYFGEFYFEALILMRNTMVMSILTYNLEIVYNLKRSEIKSLDTVDTMLLKNALMSSSKVSRSLILLELGLISVEYLIKQKRIGYLHTILNSDDNALVKKVFNEQLKSPINGDYVKYVNNDLKELEINMNFEDIRSMSKAKWKILVRKQTKKACFKSLMRDKAKLSKGKEILYTNLETQSYFKPGNTLSTTTKRRIFKARSRDMMLKCNFPNAFGDLQCVTGCDKNSRDDQPHLFHCYLLSDNAVSAENIMYDDLFQQNNVVKQEQVVNILFKHFDKRKQFLSPDADRLGPLDPGCERTYRSHLVIPEKRQKLNKKQKQKT